MVKIGTLLNSIFLLKASITNKFYFVHKRVSIGDGSKIEGKVYVFGHKGSVFLGGGAESYLSLN